MGRLAENALAEAALGKKQESPPFPVARETPSTSIHHRAGPSWKTRAKKGRPKRFGRPNLDTWKTSNQSPAVLTEPIPEVPVTKTVVGSNQATSVRLPTKPVTKGIR